MLRCVAGIDGIAAAGTTVCTSHAVAQQRNFRFD